jgi:hypothetical protein
MKHALLLELYVYVIITLKLHVHSPCMYHLTNVHCRYILSYTEVIIVPTSHIHVLLITVIFMYHYTTVP